MAVWQKYNVINLTDKPVSHNGNIVPPAYHSEPVIRHYAQIPELMMGVCTQYDPNKLQNHQAKLIYEAQEFIEDLDEEIIKLFHIEEELEVLSKCKNDDMKNNKREKIKLMFENTSYSGVIVEKITQHNDILNDLLNDDNLVNPTPALIQKITIMLGDLGEMSKNYDAKIEIIPKHFDRFGNVCL